MLMSTMSSHKHKKGTYTYAYVAAVPTSAQASYAYVYSCACAASEDRPLSAAVLKSVTMVHKCSINQAPPYLCNLFHNRFSVQDVFLFVRAARMSRPTLL